ncbi:hypothetical protein CCACVL1_15584 [Corchorus capsularis]|uniref:Uncharacterized protein n=1 Tax=Corchorus capsularis TaxID=210143 RepID=A0A1R3I1T7_COCAP|nr:hypothetical protein CCACVL1_15584 [Corchorus capsularis]
MGLSNPLVPAPTGSALHHLATTCVSNGQ